MVFINEDGTGTTKDGDIISADIMATLETDETSTRTKEYDAARKERAKLAERADDVQSAHDEINDSKAPATRERLEEIEKDMRDISKSLNGISTIKPSFETATEAEQTIAAPQMKPEFANFAL